MARRKKTSVTCMSSEHRKNFARCIEFIGRVHNPWTVFSDFLAMTAITISNNSDPYHIVTNQNTQKEREKRYLEIIGKYDKREQALFISMFTELMFELERSFKGKQPHLVDVLGELFHELNFNDEWKGQFFTPQHICDMAGKLVIGDNSKVEKEIDEHGYFTIYEPCCGGGAMIYGAINAMFEIGFNPNKDVLIIAGDIDERCIFMTFIQCSLYGIPAVIQQKNALTAEVLSPAWVTPVFTWHSWRYNNLQKESVTK